MDDLEYAHTMVRSALRHLSHLFTPDCRLTFVMRKPVDADCNLVVTDDDLQAVEDVIRERRTKEGR